MTDTPEHDDPADEIRDELLARWEQERPIRREVREHEQSTWERIAADGRATAAELTERLRARLGDDVEVEFVEHEPSLGEKYADAMFAPHELTPEDEEVIRKLLDQ